MKNINLIHHRYRPIAWMIFLPGLILGSVAFFNDYSPEFLDYYVWEIFPTDGIFENSGNEGKIFAKTKNNLFNEIAGIMVILGGLLLMISSRKREDEMLIQLRLNAILWSAKLNAVLMVVSFVLIYDFNFYIVMLVNLILLYLLFALKFEWEVWKLNREGNEE